MEWAVRTRTRHRTDGLNCFPSYSFRSASWSPRKATAIRRPKCATALSRRTGGSCSGSDSKQSGVSGRCFSLQSPPPVNRIRDFLIIGENPHGKATKPEGFRGAGLKFSERGLQELKGLPRRWDLIAASV
jgi:hypothetical protein